jgi:hypothetical protein
MALIASMSVFSACSPATTADVPQAAPSSAIQVAQAPSASSDGTLEKLYGLERFTIVLQYRSRFVGTRTIHVRDWGRSRAIVEIQRRVGDPEEFTYDLYQVCRRGKCFHKDGADGEIETADDFGYALILQKLTTDPTAYDAAQAFVPARLERSGRKDIIAGQDCEYWTNSSGRMNSGGCYTSWGGMLSWGNSDQSKENFRAVEVRVNDGGPDAAFNWAPASSPTTSGRQ